VILTPKGEAVGWRRAWSLDISNLWPEVAKIA